MRGEELNRNSSIEFGKEKIRRERVTTAEQIGNSAKRASREAIPWVIWLARLGYAAKGTVYIIIGALAFQAAIGTGGETTDQKGALQQIAQEPFGQVLLAIVAVGLFGYAIWRFVQSWLDPDNEGSDATAIVKRIGWAISGIIYAAFGVSAISILIGAGGGGSSADDLTAMLMSQPFGIWLVGIVGAIVVGVGLYQFYRAYKAKFQNKLKLHEMSVTEMKWAKRLGRLGFSARGVVYTLIGIFLVQAAIRSNPDQAGGIGEALSTLAQQPYGPYLLGIVALGLIASGAFAFVQARYRRIFIS